MDKIVKSEDEFRATRNKMQEEGYTLSCMSNENLPAGQVRLTFEPGVSTECQKQFTNI